MTENEIKETKEWLQDFIRTFGCNFDDLETRGFNECVVCLEEIQQYRTIGTVDEFKALKDDTIPIIHGKSELELHDNQIRAKAIDDFAKVLKEICKNHPISNDGHTPLYIHEDGTYHELIEDAVKQMKAGGIDG